MLPKKYRLKVQEFYRNKNPAKTVSGEKLVLLVKDSLQSGQSKFCVLTPKKLDKRSSSRNEMRRLVVEAIRPLLPRIKTSKNAMIKPKKIFKKEDRASLKQEVAELFARAGLI